MRRSESVRTGVGRSAGTWILGVMAVIATLGGCSTARVPQEQPVASTPSGTSGKGGYYLDDGPGDNPPADLADVPDAVPRPDPLNTGAMKPYTVLGVTYVPMTELRPYRARGIATWYGRRYHGKRTSTGEIYDMYAMTAAHTTLPLPCYARVTSIRTGRSVVVRVNDRGPFRSDRLIDLSYAAAYRLGLLKDGSGLVDVELILPGESGRTMATGYSGSGDGTDDSPLATMPPTSGVFLQFAAFSDVAYASDFVRKMRAELPDLARPVSVFAMSGLYRVQAGPFADRDSAQREADRVGARLGARPFVLER
ncbi:MAG: septal ring lytic transglycosylase RlpA family protein [Betaproteobacteria bacterium]|nr:septal ring lytic transglycosylase RlpA family protein [Betaproteobacteria bacterium]